MSDNSKGESPSRKDAFVEHYLRCRNAVAAARHAGYSGAINASYRLKKDPYVIARLKEATTDDAISTQEALNTLGEICRAEWQDYIETPDETLPGSHRVAWVNIAQMKKDGKAHLIQGIEQRKDGVKVIFQDRMKALQFALQCLGVMTTTASEADLAAFLQKFASNKQEER